MTSHPGLELLYLIGRADSETERAVAEWVDTTRHTICEFLERVDDFQAEHRDELMNGEMVEVFCALGKRQEVECCQETVRQSIRNYLDKLIATEGKVPFLPPVEQGAPPAQILAQLFLDHLADEAFLHIPCSSCLCLEQVHLVSFSSGEDRQSHADALPLLWSAQENPFFLGKQLVTRSFLLGDLHGRRVIAHQFDETIPYLILEGGVKWYLDSQIPYIRERVGIRDIDLLSPSDIDSIVSNPIYHFGLAFVPHPLFDDWHKVLIYALAIRSEQWSIQTIRAIYSDFIDFIQQAVCDTLPAEVMFPGKEELFYQTLLVQIENMRAFLKGEEEQVISKDLLLLLQTRYIYLDVLYPVIEKSCPEFHTAAHLPHPFCREKLWEIAQEIDSPDANRKGIAWENTAQYILNCIPGLLQTGKRLITGREEIDLCYCNTSTDQCLWQLGALILVECKSWKGPVGIPVIRQLAHIMSAKGLTAALLFSKNGITKKAEQEIFQQALKGQNIYLFTWGELMQLQTTRDVYDLLLAKIDTLTDSISDDIALLGA